MSHVLHIKLQVIVLGVKGVDDLGELGDLLAKLVEHVVRHHVVGALLLPGDVTIHLHAGHAGGGVVVGGGVGLCVVRS